MIDLSQDIDPLTNSYKAHLCGCRHQLHASHTGNVLLGGTPDCTIKPRRLG